MQLLALDDDDVYSVQNRSLLFIRSTFNFEIKKNNCGRLHKALIAFTIHWIVKYTEL